jgi:hypothetical protein
MRADATRLAMQSSSDLQCVNIMCERVGQVRGGGETDPSPPSHPSWTVHAQSLRPQTPSLPPPVPFPHTQGCACRLALSLDRMPALEEVDVRGNRLPVLPDSLWTRPRLRTLLASENELAQLTLPSAAPSSPSSSSSAAGAAAAAAAAAFSLPHLRVLDLSNNRLTLAGLRPLFALARQGGLPALEELRLAGNPAVEGAAGGGTRDEVERLAAEAGVGKALRVV